MTGGYAAESAKRLAIRMRHHRRFAGEAILRGNHICPPAIAVQTTGAPRLEWRPQPVATLRPTNQVDSPSTKVEQ